MLEKPEKPADPTRERILDAALDLFGERGLTGTTVRDIAARAKVNVAAISYHFGGKDELYRAVAETVIGSIGGRVRGRVGALLATPPGDPEAALAALEELYRDDRRRDRRAGGDAPRRALRHPRADAADRGLRDVLRDAVGVSRRGDARFSRWRPGSIRRRTRRGFASS